MTGFVENKRQFTNELPLHTQEVGSSRLSAPIDFKGLEAPQNLPLCGKPPVNLLKSRNFGWVVGRKAPAVAGSHTAGSDGRRKDRSGGSN
jgi:hypothetical protein